MKRMEMTDTLAQMMMYAEDLYMRLESTIADIEGMTGKKWAIDEEDGKIKMMEDM